MRTSCGSKPQAMRGAGRHQLLRNPDRLRVAVERRRRCCHAWSEECTRPRHAAGEHSGVTGATDGLGGDDAHLASALIGLAVRRRRQRGNLGEQVVKVAVHRPLQVIDAASDGCDCECFFYFVETGGCSLSRAASTCHQKIAQEAQPNTRWSMSHEHMVPGPQLFAALRRSSHGRAAEAKLAHEQKQKQIAEDAARQLERVERKRHSHAAAVMRQRVVDTLAQRRDESEGIISWDGCRAARADASGGRRFSRQPDLRCSSRRLWTASWL